MLRSQRMGGIGCLDAVGRDDDALRATAGVDACGGDSAPGCTVLVLAGSLGACFWRSTGYGLGLVLYRPKFRVLFCFGFVNCSSSLSEGLAKI